MVLPRHTPGSTTEQETTYALHSPYFSLALLSAESFSIQSLKMVNNLVNCV